MSGQIERAAALLFPEHGRRALDVKFFLRTGVSAEALAEQVIMSFAALDDESSVISDVDHGLTA